jgi:two-component system cell cycle response regulator DivK
MELISQKKRILVLDKNSRMLSVVDEIMMYGDFDVQTIYDPNVVYDKAKDFHPDVIILDYLLLDKDCALICRDFKDDANFKNVPIIVVASYRTQQVTNDSYNCDALFVKPLDMMALASRMDYLMAS